MKKIERLLKSMKTFGFDYGKGTFRGMSQSMGP